jgi:putative membrane protein
MNHFLIRLLINAAALFLVAYIVPGVAVTGPLGAIVGALVLGVVNAILRPILIILSLPIQIVTLGLFTLVINAALFWFVGHLGIGLIVNGWWPALLGSIILSIVSFVLTRGFAPARR